MFLQLLLISLQTKISKQTKDIKIPTDNIR